MRERFASCLCIIITFLVAITSLHGQEIPSSIHLAWDQNPDGSVIGYLVYYGTALGDYSTRINAGTNTTVVVSNLRPGTTYHFVVTAYNASGIESDPSNEVILMVPDIISLSLQSDNWMHVRCNVTAGNSYALQSTSSFTNWTTVGTYQAQTNSVCDFVDVNWKTASKRFYRLLIH